MKPFRVSILQYDERVCKMHNLAKYTTRHFTKGREYYDADWAVCDNEFSDNEFGVATRKRLPTFVQDELYDKEKDCRSITH